MKILFTNLRVNSWHPSTTLFTNRNFAFVWKQTAVICIEKAILIKNKAKHLKKKKKWVVGDALGLKALALKPNNQSSTLRTHMVEEQN